MEIYGVRFKKIRNIRVDHCCGATLLKRDQLSYKQISDDKNLAVSIFESSKSDGRGATIFL